MPLYLIFLVLGNEGAVGQEQQTLFISLRDEPSQQMSAVQ